MNEVIDRVIENISLKDSTVDMILEVIGEAKHKRDLWIDRCVLVGDYEGYTKLTKERDRHARLEIELCHAADKIDVTKQKIKIEFVVHGLNPISPTIDYVVDGNLWHDFSTAQTIFRGFLSSGVAKVPVDILDKLERFFSVQLVSDTEEYIDFFVIDKEGEFVSGRDE